MKNMPKRIPGPHDERVLPIQRPDPEIKTSLQAVLDRLRRLSQQVNPRYITGFSLMAHGKEDGYDLKADLRRAADALASWRKLTPAMGEAEYYELHSTNEQARRAKMKEKRRKG